MAVIDASALLAYLRGEPGEDVVADALADGVSIAVVNLAEALSKAADHGADPAVETNRLTAHGLLDAAITVEPFTRDDATEVARLRPLTRKTGLSLADRACLALARRLETVALTADRHWAKLNLGVDVRLIR